MKYVRILILVALAVQFASGSLAQCPVPGIYSTLTSTVLPGRSSEAWCGDVGPGVPGNTDNAMSWDGVTLGGQWRAWGMYIDGAGAIETGRDMDGFGNGWIDYEINYLGGQFWLSKDHAWGDGITDPTGTITYCNVGTRVTYIEGNLVGATSNVTLRGVFTGCPDCVLEYVITNAMLVWRSDSGLPRPDDYPDFLCGASSGELYEVCCITAFIRGNVANEEKSWGAIKSLYR